MVQSPCAAATLTHVSIGMNNRRVTPHQGSTQQRGAELQSWGRTFLGLSLMTIFLSFTTTTLFTMTRPFSCSDWSTQRQAAPVAGQRRSVHT
jgi:hypothetical protein